MRKILVFCVLLGGFLVYAEDPATMIEKLKGPAVPLGDFWKELQPRTDSYLPIRNESSLFTLTEFLIDTSQTYIGSAGQQRYPGIAFDGTNFMAVWMDYARPGVVGARIAQDGTILDESAFLISSLASGDQPDIVFNGINYFVVWAVAPNIYGARIKPDGTVLDPTPILISNTGTYTPAVAYGNGVYLVVWETTAGNFDALAALVDTNGTVLVEFPLANDPNVAECWPNAEFNGTNFLAVWYIASFGECGIMGSRILPDGTNLDPGGFHITYQTGNGDSHPVVDFDGTNWFVLFSRWNISWLGRAWVTPAGIPFGEADIPGTGGLVFPELVLGDSVHWLEAIDLYPDPDIYATRIDFQGNVLDSPWIAVDTPHYYQAYGGDAYGDSTFIAIWEDQETWDIYARRYAPDATPLDSTRFLVNIGGFQNQYEPEVAFDGTNYLTVYRDFRKGTSRCDIYGSRITQNGTLLDPEGFPIHQGVSNEQWPAIAFGDSLYLCAWQTQGGYDIWGARILPDGTVLDPNGFQITFGASIDSPWSVAYKNGLFLVVYYKSAYPGFGIRATRVTPDGQVLDPEGILLREPIIGTPFWPEVAPYGNGFLATWHWAEGGNTIFEGARIDFQGTVLDSYAIQISPPGVGGHWHGTATNGDTFLVVWDRNTTEIYGARVDSSGTVLDTAGIPICVGQSNNRTQPSAAFNGKDFLVVWQDSRQDASQYDLYGARVSPDGVVLDTNGIEFVNSEYSRVKVELASATPEPDTGAQVLLVFDGFVGEPYNANRTLGAIYYPPTGIKEGYVQKILTGHKITISPNISRQKPYVLSYSIPRQAEINVNIYDITGQKVKNVYNGNIKGTGEIKFTLQEMPQAIYFVRVETENRTETTKVIWLK